MKFMGLEGMQADFVRALLAERRAERDRAKPEKPKP